MSSPLLSSLRLLRMSLPHLSPLAPSRSLRIPPIPPEIENTEHPAKHKLQPQPKVPHMFGTMMVKTPKGTKQVYRMQGEDTTHNKLMLKQYGVIAVSGGAMNHAHFEMCRGYVNRHMNKSNKGFAMWRVDGPWKAVTRHGLGRKLGGGKGPISHYETPIKAGRVIMEVGGNILWEEAQPWLQLLTNKLPFDAICVNQELLEKIEAEEKRLVEVNENPYTFEWLVRNNIMDCHSFLSPRDQVWFGKFVYRDRTMNKKWNLVRQRKIRRRY